MRKMVLLLLYIFSSLLVLGPCTAQDDSSSSSSGGIDHISITYCKYSIESVCFFSSQDDSHNCVFTSKCAVGTGGKQADQINIDAQDEKITTIRGTFLGTVTSLSFVTDKKTYGPFGIPNVLLLFPNGDHFSFEVNDDIDDWKTKFSPYSYSFESSIISKKPLSVGPWGATLEPGTQWTYEPNGAISKIVITHDVAINSIQFTSQDDSGNIQESQTFGTTNGTNSDEIVIDTANEKLNYINGTVGVNKDNNLIIISLSFSTDSKKAFGPFGTPSGTEFSLLTNESFIGFFGHSDSVLDSIGIYLAQVPEHSLGTWGSQDPGNEWSYVPEGTISKISLTYDDNVIHTISFTSKDDEGNFVKSDTFGWTTGANSTEIDFENEKLGAISGTIDKYSGYISVTSLQFANDKNIYFGPFGSVSGTAFSARVNDGIIGGFYGRAGSWLDSIGIIVKPTDEVQTEQVCLHA